MGITSDFIKSNQVSKINELIPMAKLIFTKIHISILIKKQFKQKSLQC